MLLMVKGGLMAGVSQEQRAFWAWAQTMTLVGWQNLERGGLRRGRHNNSLGVGAGGRWTAC